MQNILLKRVLYMKPGWSDDMHLYGTVIKRGITVTVIKL